MNSTIPASAAASSINKVTNLVIASVLFMFGLYAFDEWGQVRDREEEHMQSNLVLLTRTLDTFFLSKRAGMLSLAETIAISPGGIDNLAQVQQLLVDYLKYRPEVSQTYVSDMNGQLLASSHTPSLQGLPSLAAQPSFQDFARDARDLRDIYLGRPQRDALDKDWVFTLRYVLRDQNGQAQAVLTDVFPVDFLESLWKDAPLVQQLTVGVLRDDGYLMTRFPVPAAVTKDEVYGTRRAGALIRYLTQQQFPVQGRVEGPNALLNGQNFVNLFHRLDKLPVTVFVGQSERRFWQVWARSIDTPLALTALLLTFIKFVSLRLARRESESAQQRLVVEQVLRDSETEQRSLIDNLMTGLVIHDATGAVVRCNAEASNLLGLSFEQMTGKQLIDPAWSFLNEEGQTMPVSDYPASRVVATREPVNGIVVGIVRSKDADICWVLCRADPWFTPVGALDKIVVTFVDITMRRKLTSQLQDRELKFQALFDNSMDAVLLTSPDGTVLAVNQAACRLFDLSEAQIIARGRTGLADPADPRLQELLVQRQQRGQAAGLLTMVRGDGSHFTAEISSSIYGDSEGRQYSSMIVRDITERLRSQAELEAANAQMRRINEQLAEVAHFDMLTHLPNRVLLADRLQQAMAHCVRRNKSLAVAFLDLDGFKDINDRYGHAAGDEFLVAIAKRLRSALRDGDTLARIGGDEFVAVMTDLTAEQDCEPLLLRLLQVAAEPLLVSGQSLQVSASIGVTIYPQDGSSSEQLIRHADQAMYLAKQAGKNRFHLFDVASDAAIRIKRESLEQIATAIAQRELVLYYQPQVNMQTGEVVGMEALVRWLHPQRGLLAPSQFLPVIEDHDMAIAIGERVLDMALSQMAQWLAVGLRMPVSVNVFSKQLQQEDFVHKLRLALAVHPSVPSSALELEIVETSALQDMAQVSGLMHACAELGVRFALDDFGTGYSSLTYLKKLPAELLKIDQSFVRDMLEDRDDLAIVQGVVGLSKAFNRKVIAEGVETVDHGRTLLAMGCVLGQGYGIARPMPAQQVPGWLDQWRAQQPWVRETDADLPD
ncbi:PAS domain S-box-containing protein/diguanylate cyclase (GGDEF)-like protein [Acidovorax delafieldii]|uniref:PAS domain S-box-containing protein/diguanylate cyclase (GGDEF)-like protein n=1 Tax=Acidovorax delafieldii TaxID=47920 RepID=A0A561XQM6_ACIDE|nr:MULTISPECIES: EAL domain-containing protein [Acidovorax]PIF17672.1 PAS domain S-box-containing protein/diguanylate cyclase (GGDEF)-like protein [Acidovorax sp. 59]PKW03304.1 PAS domain S-box-containing protein/diguanylate cyclase (GGDEF)-like protein [Acidovorax sp. 30]TWG38425.1 PAS domain S-box-containing protein/diguanylate cyclase (GGDEF)-like protein [Acidovorax delafieldii]